MNRAPPETACTNCRSTFAGIDAAIARLRRTYAEALVHALVIPALVHMFARRAGS